MHWTLWTGLGLIYFLMGCGILWMRGCRPRHLTLIPLILVLFWPLVPLIQACHWFVAEDESAGWPYPFSYWRSIKPRRNFEDLACRGCGTQVCVDSICDADSHICDECKKKAQAAVAEAHKEPPADPDSPEYDRKAAVVFLLEGIVEDMRVLSHETYAVSNAIDGLDEEVLKEIDKSTGVRDFLGLLMLYSGMSSKLAFIRSTIDTEPMVKEWLSKVLYSIQQAHKLKLQEERETK